MDRTAYAGALAPARIQSGGARFGGFALKPLRGADSHPSARQTATSLRIFP